MCEAQRPIEKDRPAATALVAKFLNMPLDLTTELMPKIVYDMNWTDDSLHTIKDAADLLTAQGKMKAPLDYGSYIDTALLKKVRPEAVKITKMPPA
ncbi:MAG: hypothetical protein WDO24_04100 [Pseudomonadota bacterium]